MMPEETPKQQALILVSTFWNTKVETPNVRESIMSKELAIQCSLNAVYKIKEAVKSDWSFMQIRMEYWEQVQKELESL